MANLTEILDGANGGDAIGVLGRELNLTPEQTQSAVAALVPALSAGLKKSTETIDGLGNLFALLAQIDNLPALYDDAKLALAPEGLAAGNQALSFIFNAPDASQAIADQAQKASGVDSSALGKLLPALAGIVFSGLLRVEPADSGPLKAQAAAGPFDGGGGLGDILGQVLGRVLTGGGGSPAPAPSPGGAGPLGDILGQIFGRGASAGPAPAPSPSPSSYPAPADTGGQSGGLGGDLLGTIFREVLKGIQNGTIKPVIIGGGGPIQLPGGPGGGSGAPQQVPGGDVFGQILKDILGGALGGGAPQGGPVQIPQGPQGGGAPTTQAGSAPTPPLKDLSDLTKQLGVVGGAGAAVFGDRFEHGQDADPSHLDSIQRILDDAHSR